MNFKQKLTYMLIGSLFTLAGYFLANFGDVSIAQQQNNDIVADTITCKALKVVN